MGVFCLKCTNPTFEDNWNTPMAEKVGGAKTSDQEVRWVLVNFGGVTQVRWWEGSWERDEA